jgi:hypothetical protein
MGDLAGIRFIRGFLEDESGLVSLFKGEAIGESA